MNLDVFLTKQCNMKCEFCGAYIDTEPQKLKANDIDKILHSGRKYGFRYTTFSGGEPLLYNELEEALKFADSNGFWVNITTNGLLISQETIDFLKDKNVNLRVSLHTLDPKKHWEITGTDTLEKVISNIQLLKRNQMYFSLGCTIYDENINEIENMVDFAFQQNAAFIRFTPVVGVNKGKVYSTDKEFYSHSIKKIIEQSIKYKDFLYYEKGKISPDEKVLAMMTTRRCPAGSKLFMIVDSENNLIPCQFIPMEKGWYIELEDYDNLEKDFENLRKIMNYNFKEGLEKGHRGICSHCEYVNTCQGGCLANRLQKGLTISDEQPICLYHIMRDLFEDIPKTHCQLLLDYWYYYYNQRITGKDKIRACVRKLPIWEVNFRMDKPRKFNPITAN